MNEFIELTEEFAKKIGEMENERKKIAEFLKEVNNSTSLTSIGHEVMEGKLIYPIKKINVEKFTVAGIDGGLLKQSLHGIDIMLLRAVGVFFVYQNGKLVSTEYYPSSVPSPTPKVFFDPYSEIEFEILSNMERQIIEIETARETLEKFEPQILLLHGSILPHYSDRPSKSSLLFSTFQRMIDTYKNFLDVASKSNTVVAGVVEDSRGTRFCEVIARKVIGETDDPIARELKFVLSRTKDTHLLTHLLNLNERTLIFRYSANPENHPVLRDFGEVLANEFYTYYLKTAEFDRPIRIDFFGHKGVVEIADVLSPILIELTTHSGYGLPSVLIEADQRVKLGENDLEFFYNDLINKIGNIPGLFMQRREQRPI